MNRTPSSTPPSQHVQSRVCCSVWTWAAYALPIVLLAALVTTYAVAPDFYLTYVLEAKHRETQVVEITTFIAGVLASLLLAFSTFQLYRRGWTAAAAIVGVIALATIFFTGEEVNWGQPFFNYNVPDKVETNLHNADTIVSMQSLGSIFLIVMFLLLPLAWRFRDRLNLPASWAPAIAPGPVVFTFICGFAWSRTKDVYMWLTGATGASSMHEFAEQMKEHKEMLFAIGLLMFGAYLIARLRTLTTPAPQHPGQDSNLRPAD